MPGARIAIIVLRHFGFAAVLAAAAVLSPAAAQNPGPLYSVTTIGGTALAPFGNGDGGRALDARLSGESLARDSKGSLYIGERGTGRVRKIAPSGAITTVAGPGVPGFSADGAAGTIQLGFSLGIAVDASDALIIADTEHHRVLRLDASGALRVIAGTGAPGGSGDGGLAASATLTLPFGLALDREGSLFIGEYSTGRVRRVTPDGVIATVAQHACPRANCSVWGLAVDGAGDLYIADGISTIAKMTPDGAIATIAGSDPAGFGGDGGPAKSAQFYAPSGIALDGAGNLYVADTQNQRVRKIAPDGIVTTIAGTRQYSDFGALPTGGVLLGPDRDALQSELQFPVAVLPDGAGNILIAEQSLLRRVDAAGRLFAIAGTNAPGEGGPATSAELRIPASVAMDAAGNIYFSDAGANRVRRIGANGILTTVVGTGEQGYEGDGGPASTAVLNGPLGIALDGVGNLYVADSQNQRVRKIGADGVIRTVVTRGAGAAMPTDSGLFIPTSLAVDRSGYLYIADPLTGRVRRLGPDGTLQTVAGGAAPPDDLGDGGPAIAASLQSPEGIALDAAGNLYIADTGQHRVRKVSPSGIITTVAGKGNERGEPVRDGIPAISAYLPDPASVAADAHGNVFISDRYDSSVRVVGADGIITTLAGYGADVAGADGGPAFSVGLSTPHGILTDAAGGVFVAEGDPYIAPGRVRRIAPQPGAGGPPRLWAVLNGGSWLRGEPVSPGTILSLFGADLGPTAGVTNRPDSSGRYGTDLAGVRVLFNGIPGPILYAQAYQVNVVVPFAVPLETAVAVELTYNGKASQYVSNIAIGCCVAARPELFKWSASPRPGQAAALNQDGSINSAENPAAAGSIVTLYATGAGAMNPPLEDGIVVSGTSARPLVPLTVRIGGVTADVLYAGAAPGLVAGVLQINVRVPQTFVCRESPACSDQSATPVVLQMGQYFSSQTGAIAVRY